MYISVLYLAEFVDFITETWIIEAIVHDNGSRLMALTF